MHHGLKQDFLYTAVKIRAFFEDANGNKLKINGTGFFISNSRGEYSLITNRHIVDAPYFKPKNNGQKLQFITIAQKIKTQSGLPEINNKIKVIQPDLSFAKNYDNDVVAIRYTEYEILEGANQDVHMGYPLHFSMLADASVLKEEILICDFVAFPGFPRWHDQSEGRPIMRTGTIASDPMYNFSWGETKGDCIAYEAFSYNGSSGSPVFALQKGNSLHQGNILIDSKTGKGGGFRRPYLIGINAGHLNGIDAPVNYHSGISYMYKSTIILELIEKQ